MTTEDPDFLVAEVRRLHDDPVAFCRTILPHWFPKPMPWIHRAVLAIRLRRADFLLNFGEEIWAEGRCRWTKKDLAKLVRNCMAPADPSDPNSPLVPIFHIDYKDDNRTPRAVRMRLGQHTMIVLPRGFSKTTLMNAAELHDICYMNGGFDLYVSDTGPQADMQTDTLRRELSSNERIIALYGIQQPSKNSGKSWAADNLETEAGYSVKSRGANAQIRGSLKFAQRPGRIILDDIENIENTSTDSQREKLETWYFKDIEPALPRINGVGHILWIATLLGPQTLTAKLMRDRRFTVVKFGAIDRDGEALWSEYMSLEKLESERTRYASLGRLPDFYTEYMSEVRNEALAKFRGPFTYTPRDIADTVGRAIVVDPAISGKPGADFASIAVVGMTEKGVVHIYDVWMKRGAHPREIVDQYFEMKVRWKTTQQGAEAVAYQRALSHMLQEEMWRKTKEYGAEAYFEITNIYHSVGKDERILGILGPRYKAGYVTHQRAFPDYEAQLLDYPLGKKDGPDAVAMAVAMLDPYAPYALDDPEKVISDAYEPLEYEGGAP